MKRVFLFILIMLISIPSFCWGFYAHRLINYFAVFLLPPEMMALYKPHIGFLSEHAVDPDKRRYAVKEEGARHYLDIDHYGRYPYDSLPRKWKDAVAVYTEDTLKAHGIVPWWIQVMLNRLTAAFREKNQARILKLSAELGHYIGDLHVPLHVCSNHNGQLTNQQGIHGFWESRVPELLAESSWDFFIGPARYITDPSQFIWARALESAAAADSTLSLERKLNAGFATDQKYAFENKNGVIVKQYSKQYALAYDKLLNNMVERRMRQAIYATASCWYTAWVNAGQPNLGELTGREFLEADTLEFELLNAQWKTGSIQGKSCD